MTDEICTCAICNRQRTLGLPPFEGISVHPSMHLTAEEYFPLPAPPRKEPAPERIIITAPTPPPFTTAELEQTLAEIIARIRRDELKPLQRELTEQSREIASLKAELKQHCESDRYLGTWSEGEYQANNSVTFGGSIWKCLRTTRAKPGMDGAWQLACKRGRNGKDADDVISTAEGESPPRFPTQHRALRSNR